MGEAWRRVVASGILEGCQSRCVEKPPHGLSEGIRLFNAGRYYECHNALEDLWHAEAGPIRYLYQGILQIGVGFHHWRSNNYRGAMLLLTDGIDKVHYFSPCCLDVDTDRLLDDARRCLRQLHAFGPAQMSAFDWDEAPRIRHAATPDEGASEIW